MELVKEKTQNKSEFKKKIAEEAPASFETAIAATSFGKYNFFLLFITSVPCMSQLFNTVELSYVVTVAQCDLNLTLEDRGVINAIMFAGMIPSGFFWGYLCDALGRKKIITYGYLLSGIFGLLAAFSVNKTMLLIAKFMTGVVLTGPFSAITSHINEFHSSQYRGKINIIRGIFFSLANLILPILAWAVLSKKRDINVFGLFVLHSWNIFLVINSSALLLSSFLYIFVPESPKYLMSVGRNNEALKIMQNVFSVNTGRPMNEFPIKELEKEVAENSKNISIRNQLKIGFKKVVYIFRKPHVNYLVLACCNVFCLTLSLNTLKLWLPGIFQSISDYQNSHNGTSSSICLMMENMKPQNVSTHSETCTVVCYNSFVVVPRKKYSKQSKISSDTNNLSVYINTFIVASTRLLLFVITGTFIRLLGIKTLNIICCYISAILMFSNYFATNAVTVTALSAIGTGIGSVGENLLVTLTFELFPTSLRATAISLHFTLGRSGTLIGNIIFPYLIKLGCLPPFLYIGAFAMACGTISFLYPSIENKPLK